MVASCNSSFVRSSEKYCKALHASVNMSMLGWNKSWHSVGNIGTRRLGSGRGVLPRNRFVIRNDAVLMRLSVGGCSLPEHASSTTYQDNFGSESIKLSNHQRANNKNDS